METLLIQKFLDENDGLLQVARDNQNFGNITQSRLYLEKFGNNLMNMLSFRAQERGENANEASVEAMKAKTEAFSFAHQSESTRQLRSRTVQKRMKSEQGEMGEMALESGSVLVPSMTQGRQPYLSPSQMSVNVNSMGHLPDSPNVKQAHPGALYGQIPPQSPPMHLTGLYGSPRTRSNTNNNGGLDANASHLNSMANVFHSPSAAQQPISYQSQLHQSPLSNSVVPHEPAKHPVIPLRLPSLMPSPHARPATHMMELEGHVEGEERKLRVENSIAMNNALANALPTEKIPSVKIEEGIDSTNKLTLSNVKDAMMLSGLPSIDQIALTSEEEELRKIHELQLSQLQMLQSRIDKLQKKKKKKKKKKPESEASVTVKTEREEIVSDAAPPSPTKKRKTLTASK